MLVKLDKTSHLVPTYLVWNENQSYRSSAHARQTKQNTNRQTWNPNANRWTYIRLRTNKHTQETNCQSLDLRQTRTQNKHRQRQKWSPNANHWTYISIRTKTHSRRQTWSLNANHWTYISIRTKHTHTGTQMPLDGLTSASKHTTT